MTSRSCLNWPTTSRLCTRDVVSRWHHVRTSTYIHVIHTALACSTHSHPCTGRAARCRVSLAHRLTCVQCHRAAPFIRAAPWLLTPVVQFYPHSATLCRLRYDIRSLPHHYNLL